MSTCQACGGVIGRDCFNPQECMEITRQQAEQYRLMPMDPHEMVLQIIMLEGRIGLLHEAIREAVVAFDTLPSYNPGMWNAIQKCKSALNTTVSVKSTEL